MPRLGTPHPEQTCRASRNKKWQSIAYFASEMKPKDSDGGEAFGRTPQRTGGRGLICGTYTRETPHTQGYQGQQERRSPQHLTVPRGGKVGGSIVGCEKGTWGSTSLLEEPQVPVSDGGIEVLDADLIRFAASVDNQRAARAVVNDQNKTGQHRSKPRGKLHEGRRLRGAAV